MRQILIIAVTSLIVFAVCHDAIAQNIPSSADVGRLETKPEDILPKRSVPEISIPRSDTSSATAPDGFDDIRFTLKSVTIENITAFNNTEFSEIFAPFIGQDIPVSMLWEFARRITERYQNEGYFLSRAFVPAQEIEGGDITLSVVEGYIGQVTLNDKETDNRVINDISRDITNQRPLTLQHLESALLQLNDLPGIRFESVLAALDDAEDGAVKLVLQQEKTPIFSRVLINNHSSRFTGPHRASLASEYSFLPLHNSAFSASASIPGGNEVWSLAYNHEYRVLSNIGLNFSVSRTKSLPGFTLTANDLESQSFSMGIGVDWYAIRQRNKNLTFGLKISGQNVTTDILDTALVRERIRSAKAEISYDTYDWWNGYNLITSSITRGIEGLGSSNEGAPNLSRAAAKPDFTKFVASWYRQALLADHWVLTTSATGQKASKALFSSEEFGYGGPSLGRAYVPSELVGDNGIAGSLEIQWSGLKHLQKFKLSPYTFYDIGKIWNIDNGQVDGQSGATAGFGLKINHPYGLNANLSFAQPLTKTIATPIYGNNSRNPRLYFQMSYDF